ncbi:MAG: HlyD family efflux transporter periplasmic adaptor subunit [Candidatus Peribacteraceae bacterium]
MMFFSTLQHRLPLRLQAFLQQLQWKSVLLGLATPLMLAVIYSTVGGGTGAQEIVGEIVTVGRRDIGLSLKALGTVTLANEQHMRFNVQGKVAKVHVEAGDTIKRDALIAELDKTDPNADIRQAQLSVNDAYLRLQELEASRGQTLISAQNSVRELERQMEVAYGEAPAAQMQVADQIEQARRTVLEKEAAYKKAQQDLAAKIDNAIADADKLLADILEILSGESTIRGATRYKNFTVHFLYNDQNQKIETEFAYYRASEAYDTFRTTYGSLLNTEDVRVLESALRDAIALGQQLVTLTDVAYEFLRTAVPSSSYTDADINTWKATMNTKRTAAIALVDTLRNQQATLTEPGKNTALQNLESARENLALLESKQEHGITAADTAERTIASLRDRLQAEEQSMEKTTVSVDVQIRQQQNTLAQRQVALEKARRALEKYELRAPFDGVIRRIDFQVGDNLLADASETKYAVLENPEYFIVTVQLDQVDVVHVKEGQRAIIQFDALPSTTFEGEVGMIDTTPVQTSGVVSYAVEIVLQPSEEYTILSGMTASVEIQIASAKNAIAVPNLALRTSGSRVSVLSEDGMSIPIETGITDGTYTEVLSGLSPGDRIQSINVVLNTQNTTTNTSGNRGGMMPMGGFGGGMMR